MKIAVLMSGGVDSTVAAYLLKQAGNDVAGLTMVNLDPAVGEQAREAAEFLGIEHTVVDLGKTFQEYVIDYFCTAYESGQTPNPCVECNKHIKFGKLLDIALEMGFDKVATGHFARVEYDGMKQRYLLQMGADKSKDQSYFLYGLRQDQLARIILPLGNMTKTEVCKIGLQQDIKAAGKKESQEVCFIEGDYRDFIQSRIKSVGGPIEDISGNYLGEHLGLSFYTMGQRKGLGISVGRPVYVVGMDKVNNRLVVDDEKYLYSQTLYTRENNFILVKDLVEPLQAEVKIRYRAALAPAVIARENDTVKVDFVTPQRAVTPGQSAVYYQGEYVIGGGIII